MKREVRIMTDARRTARNIAFEYFDPKSKYGDRRFWHLANSIEAAINNAVEAALKRGKQDGAHSDD
jgi:predicted RNA-binding protein with PUA-like domain